MFSDFTEEYFMEQAKLLGEEYGVDTRQGSMYMDAATGHCIRVAKFFNDLNTVFEMLAVDTCTGDILTEKAAQDGILRQSATPAYYNVVFVGSTPDQGSRFFVDEYYFKLVYDDGVYLLEAELVGESMNDIEEGTVVVPVYEVNGLKSCTLGNLYIPGANEEDDDSLRKRWQEQKSGPSQNGNKSHYKTWCESILGVGRATIIPLYGGENTVKGVIYSTDGKIPAESILEDVQEYIDPIVAGYQVEVDGELVVFGDGLGEGEGNLGAHFVAMAPEKVGLSVSFEADLRNGYTLATATSLVFDSIEAYLKKLVLEGEEELVIRVSSIGSLISSNEAILDYAPATLHLNAATENVEIGYSQVPILDEVVIDE